MRYLLVKLEKWLLIKHLLQFNLLSQQ